MEKDIQEVLFSEEVIAKRVKELAEKITNDYKGKQLLVVGVLIVATKGDDPLVWNVKLDLSWSAPKEEFRYPLGKWEYNAEFRNNKRNGKYLLMGKNAENDTYRVYVVDANPYPVVTLKFDSLKMKNNRLYIENGYGTELYIAFSDNNVVVGAELGSMGDASLEGNYIRMKDITTFSMDEFNVFTK